MNEWPVDAMKGHQLFMSALAEFDFILGTLHV